MLPCSTAMPCAPPETEGNAASPIATSQARSQVNTATSAGRRRPATIPTAPPASAARTTPASTAPSVGQPAFVSSTAVAKAPRAMNAPWPRKASRRARRRSRGPPQQPRDRGRSPDDRTRGRAERPAGAPRGAPSRRSPSCARSTLRARPGPRPRRRSASAPAPRPRPSRLAQRRPAVGRDRAHCDVDEDERDRQDLVVRRPELEAREVEVRDAGLDDADPQAGEEACDG